MSHVCWALFGHALKTLQSHTRADVGSTDGSARDPGSVPRGSVPAPRATPRPASLPLTPAVRVSVSPLYVQGAGSQGVHTQHARVTSGPYGSSTATPPAGRCIVHSTRAVHSARRCPHLPGGEQPDHHFCSQQLRTVSASLTGPITHPRQRRHPTRAQGQGQSAGTSSPAVTRPDLTSLAKRRRL